MIDSIEFEIKDSVVVTKYYLNGNEVSKREFDAMLPYASRQVEEEKEG